jgi:hypothetical protein
MERNFDRALYHAEHKNRLHTLAQESEKDALNPNEAISMIIREARYYQNPYVQDELPIVVLGHDGIDNSWFPTGSFETIDEAFEHMTAQQAREHLYSDGDEVSTTFYAFTKDGIEIRHQPGIEPPIEE